MPDGEDDGGSLERLWSREIRHLHRDFSQRLIRGASLLVGRGEPPDEAEDQRGRGKAWFAASDPLAACCACPDATQGGFHGDMRKSPPPSPSGGREWDTWTANGEWEPKMVGGGEGISANRSAELWSDSSKARATGGGTKTVSVNEDAEVEEVVAGDSEFIELWPGLGKLVPENLDFWELTRGRPPRRIPCVEHRGVTPRQLRTLLAFLKKRCNEHGVIRGWYDPRTGEMLHYKTFNFHHLLHWIIKPLTQRFQCSFAEAVYGEPTSSHASAPSSPGTSGSLKGGPSPRVKWFVGHWWGESLLDFTKRIMKHTGAHEESYWICPLCTNLYECSGLAVGDVHEKAGIIALTSLTTLKVYLSGCTGLKAIQELERGLPAFQSLTFLELNVAYCWELADVEELGKSLAKLRFLRTLRMNFSDCSGLESIASLGRGFSSLASLTCLELNLSGCTGLASIDEFGASLGRLEALNTLRLDFSGCSRLRQASGLGRGFRGLGDLATLSLNFSGCTELVGVEELGRGLVMLEVLTTLEVSFFGCSSLVSLDDLGRGIALMRSLTILKLELFGCSSLDRIDELQRGIAALREHKELGTLQVNIAGCSALPPSPRPR